MQALHFLLRGAAAMALSVAAMLAVPPAHAAAGTSGADDLSARLVVLREQLDRSPLKRPVLLHASDTANGLQGEVYAIVDHPLAAISAALGKPEAWCGALLLHINNRACSVTGGSGGTGGVPVISLGVVRKYDRPADSAFQLVFDFRVAQATPQHLAVELHAAQGPLGTGNYRIVFEAVPVDATRSFLHFSYAYDESTLTAAAMQAYLATFGRSKVGFTVIAKAADGEPDYIRGTHGLLERNAMRYFLTVEAFLAAPDAAGRRNAWYSASEKYPKQLHEIDRATYLELKAADERR
jgi:hypothetical protein